MAAQKEKLIFIRETTYQSIVQDIFTYGLTVGSFFFNYKFIGGNDALDVLLFLIFFFMSAAHLKNYKRLHEEAK